MLKRQSHFQQSGSYCPTSFSTPVRSVASWQRLAIWDMLKHDLMKTLTAQCSKTNFGVTLVALALLAGCSTTNKDWNSARHDDTLIAYQSFLAQHPQSDYSSEAKSRVKELEIRRDWESTAQANTISAYADFLQKHSTSDFSSQARSRLTELRRSEAARVDAERIAREEARSFEECQRKKTVEACQVYLRNYPAGSHKESVIRLLIDLSGAIQIPDSSLLVRITNKHVGTTTRWHDGKSYQGPGFPFKPVFQEITAKPGIVFVDYTMSFATFGKENLSDKDIIAFVGKEKTYPIKRWYMIGSDVVFGSLSFNLETMPILHIGITVEVPESDKNKLWLRIKGMDIDLSQLKIEEVK